MKTMKLIQTTIQLATQTSAAMLILSGVICAQGDLAPPGAPAATMKTLDQIEPRVDVLKLSGDATASHVISSPGSYFISQALSPGAGLSGIRITASNVTLDLMGFVIDGGAGSGSAGILMTNGLGGIVIRDGTIRGFNSAIQAGTSLNYSRVSQITAYGGSTAGIDLGTELTNLVERCTVSGGSTAIRAGQVHYCTAQGGETGIDVPALVSHSTGLGVTFGIRAGDVSNCRGTANSGYGIWATGNVSKSYGCVMDGNPSAAYGINATGNVSDSTGIAGFPSANTGDHSGTGISSDGNVINSNGTGYGGIGIRAAGSVSSSLGTTMSKIDTYIQIPYSGTAIQASVISYSKAVVLSGAAGVTVTGLSCATAVGCVTSGTNTITNKYLMP